MKKELASGAKFSTTIGCGALAVWSVYAYVVSELVVILPIFQTLFLMFSVSFLAMFFRVIITRNWKSLKQPLIIWFVGVVGVCGSDVAYVTAVKYAPPAHVDFIDYLWPFLVIILSGFLPSEKLTLKHIIAGILGFLGVFLLITGGKGLLGLKQAYFPGYIFAFTAAIIWSLYTIINRWYQETYQETPLEMVGMYCGIGAIIAFCLHSHYEVWVHPSLHEGCLVGLLGLSSGVAYLLWTYGTQKGNLKLLALLAYFTPVISMSLLVLSGKEPMSYAVIFACLFVVFGVVVGSVNWNFLKLKPST